MKKRTIILLIVVCLLGKLQAQKGEKSIAGGLFITLPQKYVTYYNGLSFKTSAGLETTGQYNFTNKSAILAQLQATRFTGTLYHCTSYSYISGCTSRTYRPFAFIGLSLKGGYRYQFTRSGFYANALAGIEGGKSDSYNRYTETFFPVAFGAGKRFAIKDEYFLDVGIDRVGGYVNRWNIKVVFSLFQSSKEE